MKAVKVLTGGNVTFKCYKVHFTVGRPNSKPSRNRLKTVLSLRWEKYGDLKCNRAFFNPSKAAAASSCKTGCNVIPAGNCAQVV